MRGVTITRPKPYPPRRLLYGRLPAPPGAGFARAPARPYPRRGGKLEAPCSICGVPVFHFGDVVARLVPPHELEEAPEPDDPVEIEWTHMDCLRERYGPEYLWPLTNPQLARSLR